MEHNEPALMPSDFPLIMDTWKKFVAISAWKQMYEKMKTLMSCVCGYMYST
jgi:hypothetical protein